MPSYQAINNQILTGRAMHVVRWQCTLIKLSYWAGHHPHLLDMLCRAPAGFWRPVSHAAALENHLIPTHLVCLYLRVAIGFVWPGGMAALVRSWALLRPARFGIPRPGLHSTHILSCRPLLTVTSLTRAQSLYTWASHGASEEMVAVEAQLTDISRECAISVAHAIALSSGRAQRLRSPLLHALRPTEV
jgi:hypothetical protein